MAKKSKADQIRAYMLANPEATPVEVAKKLGVKAQYVYVLRSITRRKLKLNTIPAQAETKPRETRTSAALFAPYVEAAKDMINHPPHYTDGGMEVIDFIEAKKLGYHLGNVVKYVTRAGKKEDALQDLQKARWYLDRAISARHEAIINTDGPT